MPLVDRCSSSMCAVTHYTVNMHPAGMCLEWSDPPPFSFPLSVQQSDLRPQPRKFQDQLTPMLYGLFMETHTGCVAVSQFRKEPFRWLESLSYLVYIQGGQVGLYVPVLHFNSVPSWIRCLSRCLIDELYMQFPDMGGLWFWVGSGWNSDVLCRANPALLRVFF